MTSTGEKPSFVYVTYIHSTPERVWKALTDADLTGEYWGHSNVSDWQPGSRWEHVRTDGSGIADVVGEVIEATPPRRLVITFGGVDETGRPSVVRFDIEPRLSQVLYGAGPETALDLVRESPAEATALIVVGHNPTMAYLASLLDDGEGDPDVSSAMMSGYPTSAVVPFTLLVPVIGILAAWVTVHEVPTLTELIGGAVMLAGLAIAVVVVRQRDPFVVIPPDAT